MFLQAYQTIRHHYHHLHHLRGCLHRHHHHHHHHHHQSGLIKLKLIGFLILVKITLVRVVLYENIQRKIFFNKDKIHLIITMIFFFTFNYIIVVIVNILINTIIIIILMSTVPPIPARNPSPFSSPSHSPQSTRFLCFCMQIIFICLFVLGMTLNCT